MIGLRTVLTRPVAIGMVAGKRRNKMIVLLVGRAERLPYIVSYRQPQRSRYDEEVMSLMSFTEYCHPLLLHTFDLMKDSYAFF